MPSLREFLLYLESGIDGKRVFDATGGWAQASIVISFYRAFWSAIPESIFDPRCHNISDEIELVAKRLFGSYTSDDLRVTRVLVKRLRQYVILGRRTRVRSAEVISMLAAQSGRCAACGYAFAQHDIDAYDFTAEENSEEQIKGLNPPQVDHKIPVFIGGDARWNLQLLCRECNAAKGASLSWATHRAWVSRFSPSDIKSATAGERWLILNRDGFCVDCGQKPLELCKDARLVVAKKDKYLGWVIENMVARCTNCSGD